MSVPTPSENPIASISPPSTPRASQSSNPITSVSPPSPSPSPSPSSTQKHPWYSWLCCLPQKRKPRKPRTNQTSPTTSDSNAIPHNISPHKVRNEIRTEQIKEQGGHAAGKKTLLPKRERERKCLVLDLDETLVHSSFKLINDAHFVIPVEIDKIIHNVYVLKRPGVDEFLRKCGEVFEVVVFTASLAKYADPVLDLLDIYGVVRHRLYRDSCLHHRGQFVKDLSELGRDLKEVIIVDNSPASYLLHPKNAIPISSWFNDISDNELEECWTFLEELLHVEDVQAVLDGGDENK